MQHSPFRATEGEEQDFKLHPDFAALMGGARRKPALPIGGPAVTWHVAFWIPPHLVTRRQLWVRQIEKYILALYHHLADQGFQPHTRSLKVANGRFQLLGNTYDFIDRTGDKPISVEGQVARYQMFRVRFCYGLTPATVSLELHALLSISRKRLTTLSRRELRA